MRALKQLLIWILVLALLCGVVWYFLSFNPSLTAGLLANWGAASYKNGNTDWAIRCYSWANKLDPEDQDISMTLAGIYEDQGNYTKTEYTLVNAISKGGDEQVYRELCRIFVAQDKLLDAVEMLDHIADPGIYEALSAQRPAAPGTDAAPGTYNQYISVSLMGSGELYYATGADYPTTANPYSSSIPLELGENTVSALCVGDNGLVSPLSVFSYTIGGVVETVKLNDPALDTYVRELLGRSSTTYELTTADLWSIEEMVIPAGVVDFSQMGYFTGLLRLTIEGRKDLDISFLSQMPKLSCLNLKGCTLDPQQLSVIAGLSYLQELNISGCGLSTLAGLSGMSTLVTLDASVNSISDLSPLMGNNGLTTVHLQHNALSSFGALEGLKELTELDLSNNSISDFSSVATCQKLERLNISNNLLAGFSGISRLTMLKELDASHNKLVEISGIGDCMSLEKVNISNNLLTVMDELAVLPKLSELDLSYNDIVIIPDFPDSSVLATFNGCHNFFEDVSGLANLSSLCYVYLDYNNVADISALATCHNLVQVNVFRTNVEDVTALENMDVVISYNPT